MTAPHWGKERGGPRLRVSVVRVWESDPPPGVEPLEWVLVTSLVVTDAADALQIIAYYEKRWIIEEYHKCLKTGCAMEARQLETSADRKYGAEKNPGRGLTGEGATRQGKC